jgi:hypothetical protein
MLNFSSYTPHIPCNLTTIPASNNSPHNPQLHRFRSTPSYQSPSYLRLTNNRAPLTPINITPSLYTSPQRMHLTSLTHHQPSIEIRHVSHLERIRVDFIASTAAGGKESRLWFLFGFLFGDVRSNAGWTRSSSGRQDPNPTFRPESRLLIRLV